MKKYVVFAMLTSLIALFACDDYYDYPYDDHSQIGNTESMFLIGNVTDADSLWAIEGCLVELIPSAKDDTLTVYSDSLGEFSFLYKESYGESASLTVTDTSGYYQQYDTILYFSGRDFNAGIREIFVNL